MPLTHIPKKFQQLLCCEMANNSSYCVRIWYRTEILEERSLYWCNSYPSYSRPFYSSNEYHPYSCNDRHSSNETIKEKQTSKECEKPIFAYKHLKSLHPFTCLVRWCLWWYITPFLSFMNFGKNFLCSSFMKKSPNSKLSAGFRLTDVTRNTLWENC